MLRYSFLELAVKTGRAKKILELAQESGALLSGEFTLSSGKKSDHYFDGKLLTLHPQGAYLVGNAMFNELKDIDVDAVGGLIMGAIPIATAIALISHERGKSIPAFFVRDQAKEHGTQKRIEGHFKPDSKVAIVDDVITGGDSIMKAISAVEAEGCRVVKVLTIVDRHEGGSERLKADGYEFKALIDVWPSGKASLGGSSRIEAEAEPRLLRR